MANYSLISNATFQPFTYQELSAPIDRQDLYFEKLAEEYDKLSSQADVLEAMGKNDKDSGAYSKYKAYSDNLRKEADDLYRFGLNAESRQRLSDLRRKYNTEIIPIQNAWTKREKEADEQMKARLQNPSLMFTRDARNTSLDEYLMNPTGGYGVINGANITAQMAGMAKTLAHQVKNGRKENIDDYTYNYIEKYGLDENLVRNWQDSPTLKAMFEQVMRANGINEETLSQSANLQEIVDKSTGYAQMGMWNAIGEEKSHQIENYENRLALQMEKELAVARAKAKGSGEGEEGMGNIPSVAVGMEPADSYRARNLEVLNSLKAGQDGLKSSYFGKKMGQVNPMAIYKEYQQELKKHSSSVTYNPLTKSYDTTSDSRSAREAVLNKYRKYGVTDILSDEQYEAMSSLGYSDKQNIKNSRHSTLLKEFNKSVAQKSRYSTHMTQAAYDSFSDTALPNMKSGKYKIWKIGNNGKIGSPTDVSELNLYSKDNTKGNTITDVRYDPNPGFRGKIVLQLSDGSEYVVDPGVYNSNLTNMIVDAENRGAHPQSITAIIKDFINTKNEAQSQTSSKAKSE